MIMSTVAEFLLSAQGWIVAAAIACVVSMILGRKRNRKLPPGPPSFPIVGNLLQLGPLPHRTMAAWNQEYGPIVYCKLGSTPTITASSPQMIRELLFTQDETFASRPKTTAAQLMAYQDENVGLAPYGPHWKLMRRICVEHLLTTRRMEGFQKSRAEEAQDLVQGFRKLAEAGKTIEMREHLGSYTMNVVTRMLIGKRYFGAESMGEKEATDFRELIHAAVALHGVFYLPDHIPLLRWLWFDPNGYRRLFKTMAKRFDDYYTNIVEEHRQRQKNGESADGPKDFVDVLLGLSGENSELHLNDTEIKALIQDMVVGGTDTASFTMEWVMAEMIRNPEVMHKVQEEIDSVLKNKAMNKNMLEESDLSSLHYLKAAVKETFRLHPVGGFLIPHESIRDAKVAGYDVPKGSLVLINTHGLGRNPAMWDDVDDFRPDRFLDEKVHLRDSEYRVIPFGSGKRKCPGYQLGQSMLLLGLGRLLHGFDWFPPPGMSRKEIDVMEAYGLTTPPRTPLRAVAKTRLDRSCY